MRITEPIYLLLAGLLKISHVTKTILQMLPVLWTLCLLGLAVTRHLTTMQRGECLVLLSVG